MALPQSSKRRPSRLLPLLAATLLALLFASVAQAQVSFGKSTLSGESSGSVTSLQFGPDGRLYVASQNGQIKVYSVARNSANNYSVTGTETISLIQSIPNHNDDGSLNGGVNTRQVTGILVTGSAANPVIYVSSSDPRIGGGGGSTNTNLDTNSGVLSRLTWNGSTWQKLDLVRGLPRSEENHSSNGMALSGNTLYLNQGGHTNQGAPSNNFVFLPEYALSAAILQIDLGAIGNSTYDLPTLDDEDRPGNPDPNDPFGGNNGKNQALIVPGGPVQVYAPGFRNPYDLVLTSLGRLYTIDNGSNAGWGDVPIAEGPGGNCTNGVNEPGTTDQDTLHFVSAAGYYGGHPNPTRGNSANTFNPSNPQSPVPAENGIECDYLPIGSRGALTTFSSSTNGLAEYTASNFAGALQGDLLTASFDNTIYRLKTNGAGTALTLKEALFSSVGSTPLDVIAQPDSGPFPGTIWVGNHGGGGIITIYEPADYDGGGGPPPDCTGDDDPALDEDGDGFSNADEIDNATNPCSAADVPPDWDGDKLSNLNDPDDDNDGIPDTADPFAIDPGNGISRTVPFHYSWENDAPSPGGLLNLGFTGLMTNGTSNYESLFDPTNMTAGGAAGVTTVDAVPAGDALASTNTQQYGFQLGFRRPNNAYSAHTRILAPFAGISPQDNQSMGLFLGSGDQDNYVKLVVSANGGTGGVHFLKEVAGATSNQLTDTVSLPGPSAIDLYLEVDPASGTVQPWYTVDGGPRVNLGGPVSLPGNWLSASTLAVGIISTSAGPGPPFSATWDLLEVSGGDPSSGGSPSAEPRDGSIITAPLADTLAPRVRVRNKSLAVGRGRNIRILLRCPKHETLGCSGKVKLVTLNKVPARFVAAKKARKLTLAAKKYSIPGGQNTVVKIRLHPKRYKVVRKLKKVRVLAIVNGRDVAGNKRKTTKPLVLKLKKRATRASSARG